MKAILPRITVLLFVFVAVATLRAATPEEQEFQTLKAQRAKAAPGQSQMVDQRYRWGLEQLLKKPGTAAQPELTRQIQAELQATAGAQAAAAATATPKPLNAPATRPATKAELKKLFENSQWHVRNGTPDNPRPTTISVTFLKDNESGGSQGAWIHYKYYEVEAPDVLKIYRGDPRRNRKAEYRAFRVDFGKKIAVPDVSIGGEIFERVFLEYEKPLDRK